MTSQQCSSYNCAYILNIDTHVLCAVYLLFYTHALSSLSTAVNLALNDKNKKTIILEISLWTVRTKSRAPVFRLDPIFLAAIVNNYKEACW